MTSFEQRYPFAKSLLISSDQIQTRVRELAQKVKEYYSDKVTVDDPLMVVAVLKGAYIFAADFTRALNALGLPNIVEFICVSSYGASNVSSGEVRVLLDTRHSLISKHVLVIDDIVDSGRTLEFLLRVFRTRSPASLRSMTLLDKPARKVPFEVDWYGFTIPLQFVVGYGLDYAERFRELPDIVVLKPEVYARKSKI
jgi:hypoxanthine phosphoribosyltransferase